MSSFEVIKQKLEAFIRKYYTNELIKGAILFFAIGFLYFLLTLFIEYVLWLKPIGRTILFVFFILIETLLFSIFIVLPIAKLFKLRRGLNFVNASKIIGNHFPEVSDKLLNVLQLERESKQSELLLASIEQKSNELKPIPFRLAINFKKNIKYLKYAAIPVLIIGLSYITGKINWFSDSYERVVNYQTAYEPPAPFQFFVVNENLETIENQDFKLIVVTEGKLIPEDATIHFNNESYFLKQVASNQFEYVFTKPKKDISFYLQSNDVISKDYEITILETPTLQGFEMVLDYPSHTKKKDEVIKNNGNAVVPQGTKITWNINTKSTENVSFSEQDSVYQFKGNDNQFQFTKRLFNSTNYTVTTSNNNVQNYEQLSYAIDVIKDEYPELNVQMKRDSTDIETLYFYGRASDDYGLRSLKLVYYLVSDIENVNSVDIPISNTAFNEFYNVFPNNINLTDGESYIVYYEATDNDAVSGFKKTRSKEFAYKKLTKEEVEDNQLQEQNETIEDLNKSFDKLKEQDEELKEISKNQKEKSELNFNDKKKLENFLKRQREQEELMKNYNKKLKENLENFKDENPEADKFKEELKERLQDNEEQLKKDEELLKELEKLADKIKKEELSQKLEELAKQNKNKKRSLEQLLELTKRYYVSQKTEQLKEELNQLAEEQEKLSEESEENNTKEKQDELNKKFDDFQKELEELRKENNKLRNPMDVPNDKKGEEDIKKDQQEASESLEQKEQSQDSQEQQNSQQNAQKNQKKAAQKMKQMSEKMSQMMMGGGASQMSEDIDMLRQILDNLVLFSFDQEELMENFKSIQINHKEYASFLRKQKGLREHFEHIDDSLFALSLRQPKISEKINKEITEVFFNIDKSMSQFSENRIYQGIAAQQYTVTAANTLASFLSDVLDNMEMQMQPSKGQGQGDMQLPDIIMSQQELNEKMQEGMQKKEGEKENGEKEGDKEGDKKEGQKGKQKGDMDGKQLGEGEGTNEELNGELFEIYQRQQQLREALQDKIGKEGLNGEAKDLLQKMEEVELDLINKGFTNETLQKMISLQHQLLKLENATFQQGEDNKRKSETNNKTHNNTNNKPIPDVKKYFNTTEILNKQALPLKQNFRKKVQEYFKTNNDNL